MLAMHMLWVDFDGDFCGIIEVRFRGSLYISRVICSDEITHAISLSFTMSLLGSHALDGGCHGWYACTCLVESAAKIDGIVRSRYLGLVWHAAYRFCFPPHYMSGI